MAIANGKKLLINATRVLRCINMSILTNRFGASLYMPSISIRSAATANEGEKASSAPPPVFDKSGQWVDYYIHDDFSWLSVFGSKYPCNTFCFVSQFPSLAGRACIPGWPQAPVARVHLVGFLVRFVQPSPSRDLHCTHARTTPCATLRFQVQREQRV